MRFTALLLAVVVAGCMPNGNGRTTGQSNGSQSPRVVWVQTQPFDFESYDQAAKEFRSNHIAAQKRYADTYWRVEGSVTEIIGSTLARISCLVRSSTEKRGAYLDLFVSFHDGEVDKLKRGHPVTFVGVLSSIDVDVPNLVSFEYATVKLDTNVK